MSRERRWLIAMALLAALALLAGACDDEADEADPVDEDAPDEEPDDEPDEDEPDEDEPDEDEPDEDEPDDEDAPDEDEISLTVGDIAGMPSAFLEFAVEEGFLADEGLDVTVEASPGGAANIPGVEAGDFEIAGSNVVSVLLARQQGLGVQMVSAGTFATEDPDDDFSQILVPDDSDIQEPGDLDGRSVAVNTLANIAEVTIRASLENVGAEHENIEFVEMGFPEMIPAMEDGQVDAVHVIEPFSSIGMEAGHREIIAPYAETEPGMAIGSYFSSDAYIEENPEVIDRFVAGVTAAGEHAADNPDEVRDALVEHADLEPDVAEVVRLPDWGGPVDEGSVELIGGLMEQFGLYDETPPLDEVVYLP